ncbi:phage N-6-adenine-methyltransferase, partial [Staphylococcus aureus]|uniref:phage N-6-adenine-methyltransferase n=1 Tax=Staphylococcus aureus TaxID=1280 RepID=UPI00141561DC
IQDWSEDIVFMNPPYGRSIKRWVKKAYEESLKGATVVRLIPARTDTTYWHDYIFNKADDIRFLLGRLQFGDSKKSAPLSSEINVYRSAQ